METQWTRSGKRAGRERTMGERAMDEQQTCGESIASPQPATYWQRSRFEICESLPDNGIQRATSFSLGGHDLRQWTDSYYSCGVCVQQTCGVTWLCEACEWSSNVAWAKRAIAVYSLEFYPSSRADTTERRRTAHRDVWSGTLFWTIIIVVRHCDCVGCVIIIGSCSCSCYHTLSCARSVNDEAFHQHRAHRIYLPALSSQSGTGSQRVIVSSLRNQP